MCDQDLQTHSHVSTKEKLKCSFTQVTQTRPWNITDFSSSLPPKDLSTKPYRLSGGGRNPTSPQPPNMHIDLR